MIKRLYLKDAISFEKVELEFQKGLILFSGASGAGKSVLLNSLLGIFALKEMDASVGEATLTNRLELDPYGIENEEENVFRYVKSKTARYFINASQVSKKSVKEIAKSFIDYLSLKEYKEFEDRTILSVLDEMSAKKDKRYKKILEEYKESYKNLKETEDKLKSLEDEEKRVEELKEFAIYEVSKIEEISPKIGEYEELLRIKKELSKKEKILEAISQSENIFELESQAVSALEMLDIDSSFLSDALNELRAHFENASERLRELDEDEIESILDRLEKLSSLIQRYGSIEETLNYLKKKKENIERYENISFEKDELKKRVDAYRLNSLKLSKSISQMRKEALKELVEMINGYLNMLYLENISIYLKSCDLYDMGADSIMMDLWGSELENISSGEFNRLRLAFLSSFNDVVNKDMDGILILDEVDANLSGKESMSIAKVLKRLSKNYQIFAISHQPQLTSKADMHFLVYKQNGKSSVKELKSKDEKIGELARMISGEKVKEEAISFAKSLMEER